VACRISMRAGISTCVRVAKRAPKVKRAYGGVAPVGRLDGG
jgi:hypothetical protein